jgi:hypothetical protein
MTRTALTLLLAGTLVSTLPACIQLPPAVAEELKPAVPSRFGGPGSGTSAPAAAETAAPATGPAAARNEDATP